MLRGAREHKAARTSSEEEMVREMDYDGMIVYIEENCSMASSTRGYTEMDSSPQLNDRALTRGIVSA